MLRNIINEYLVKNIDNKNDMALLFSGGMDSLSILLSCLDVDIKPHLYTFYLDNHISEDIIRSREIAKIFDLKLTEIKITTRDISLTEDIKFIIKRFKTSKKTAIQCIHPFIYIMPNIIEGNVLSGLCADDLYGTPRSMAKHSKEIERFNKIRFNKFNDSTSSSYCYIKELIEEYDRKFYAPYKECDELTKYMLGLGYKELNSPKQKNIMYQDYKDILDKYKLYRRNSNLQCNSKIREWHDELLKTEENKNNNKSVVGIYNRYAKELL